MLTKNSQIDILIQEKDGRCYEAISLPMDSNPVIVKLNDLDQDGVMEIFVVTEKGEDNDGYPDVRLLKKYGGHYDFYWEYPGFYVPDVTHSRLSADAW